MWPVPVLSSACAHSIVAGLLEGTRGPCSTLSCCNDLSELNPSDQMLENPWEGSSASIHPRGSAELYRKPLNPLSAILKAVRTTQDKTWARHTDENSFRKHGCFGRPVFGAPSVSLFTWIHLSHLPFKPLLCFSAFFNYFFPHSLCHCFLLAFPFLLAACQRKMTKMGIPDDWGIFDPSLANSLNYTERKIPTGILAIDGVTCTEHYILTVLTDLLIHSLCLLTQFFLHIYTIQIKDLVMLSINWSKSRDFLPSVFPPAAYSQHLLPP